MKKILLVLAATLAATVALDAQDMAQATETYNNGAMALQTGDEAAALEHFQASLTMAEACGEEGAEMVANCKEYIPKIMLSIAKASIKDGAYDKGLGEIEAAIAKANEYGAASVVEDATELIPQVKMYKANDLLNNKDFAGAIEAYKDIVAGQPDNATALLRLGLAYSRVDDLANAETAYLAAAENGQEKAAKSQLGNLFLKEAQTALKAQKTADAYDYAIKSFDYSGNKNAIYLAGMAAQKLGKDDKAIEAFEQFLAVGANDKRADDVKCTLAVIAQKAGDKTKALEYYKQILTNPKYTEVAKAQIAALGK